ncbi:Aspartate aminotransferase 3 [Monocercomonoides exilis]|uniref:Aspartate aminotransferase 3 n=1 Tax=Monocercomonoides exilis TaxID=2049356 RepID=UPI00355A2386|nr:Aspartate aminotransferase 3 [Monocercomonoides exilis]|eukprot:MONOS_3822.1-p1 / transcript=MONOS_3822.1 / gene=MONOS_3822 / organism=Monocercomonoides_exilis_PA203 / gene_product= Aspartate aminotransferase 3 / transcript_product= Aspartate aminotransferase 3 / location=Mono_scaffold00094:27362-28062(+) / protein_length=93 / sequence_SO=supercontig / SO=protein_coding / is_pseudo=false
MFNIKKGECGNYLYIAPVPPEKKGAFYLFPHVPERVTDKEKRLILAVLGCAFGDSRSVRFAFCHDLETIKKAIPCIAETVKEVKEQKAAAAK